MPPRPWQLRARAVRTPRTRRSTWERTCDAVVHVYGTRTQLRQRERAKLGSIQLYNPLRRRRWRARGPASGVVAPCFAFAARIVKQLASCGEVGCIRRASVVRVEECTSKLRAHQRRETRASGCGIAVAHAAGVVYRAAIGHAVAAGACAVRRLVAGPAAHAARVRHRAAVSNTCACVASALHGRPRACGAPSQPTQPPSCQFGTPATPYSGSDGSRQPPQAPFVSCTPGRNVRLALLTTEHKARAFLPSGTPEQSGQTAFGWHTASAEPRAQAQRPHASRNLPLFGTPSQPAHVELSPPHTPHESTSCVRISQLPVRGARREDAPQCRCERQLSRRTLTS